MKAMLGDHVLAEADRDEVVRIEGNWYFPLESAAPGVLEHSDTPYTCAWKGDAQYYSVRTADDVHRDLAWSYPTPHASAISRVGADFSGHIAFDRKVTIVE